MFIIFIPFCILSLGTFYRIIEPQIKKESGRSWILTLATAAITSAVSIYPVIEAHQQGWSPSILYSSSPYSVYSTLFFLSYLALDSHLMIIKLYPPTDVSWINHLGYAAISLLTIKYGISNLVLLAYPVEFSTIPLSIGYIWPSQRRDVITATVFFTVRVVYHAWILWLLYKTRYQAPLIPLCIFPFACIAWCFHIHWFYKMASRLSRHDCKKCSR